MAFLEKIKDPQSILTTAHSVLYSLNDRKVSVFCVQIPYASEREAIDFAKYGIDASGRKGYYKTMLDGVQRHIAVMQYLKEKEVPSVLVPEQITQEKVDGVNYIFVQTQAVSPIQQVLFCNQEIELLTLLDIFIRLTVVVRDLAQAQIHHRGISLDEVFLTEDNRIVVGGFYYADAVGGEQPIVPYLPQHGKYLPPELLAGEPGTQAADMRTLAQMLYNFCAGVPWDTQWPAKPNIAPAYAPPELIPALLLGLNCKEEECNAFRRRLLDARKAIAKSESKDIRIPIHHRVENIYTYE